MKRQWKGTLLVESKMRLFTKVSHPHHAHWGLPNDRTSCGARKRPQGKSQMIGTDLSHRRETLSHSDQAPGLDKNTGPSGHRHEGLPLTANLPIGDDTICFWAGCPTAALLRWGRPRHRRTVPDSGRPLCWKRLVTTTNRSGGTPLRPSSQAQKKNCLSLINIGVDDPVCVHDDICP